MPRKPTTYTRDPETGCWNFDGPLNSEGYGNFLIASGKYAGAHRVYYERLIGPVPDGLVLDHLCRNKRCVNPEHLEPVTNRENILRGEGITAQNYRKTHCASGHELTPENVYVFKTFRMCRECRRRYRRDYARRKRAQTRSPAGKPHNPRKRETGLQSQRSRRHAG